VQDRDEKGIPYAAIILEDGTMVTTDEFGRYSVPDVTVGMHVMKLDQRMLAGGPLTKEGMTRDACHSERPHLLRSAQAPGAKNLNDKILRPAASGGEAKDDREDEIASLAPSAPPRNDGATSRSRNDEVKPENLIERRTLGGWIKERLWENGKEGEAEIASEASRSRNDKPHYRSDIPEESKFVQVPESGTAKCNFGVRLLTPAEEALQIERHSKDTQFMIVGIADGALGYLRSSGKVENIREGDNISKDLEVDNNFYQSGKVVLYAKGKIKGSYLLTTRYDSARDYHDQLYSWINPEKYYPIYGDKSTLTNDADSPGKFFVRIDKKASYAMLGNYRTVDFAGTQLLKYDRSLYGVTASISSEDFMGNDKILRYAQDGNMKKKPPFRGGHKSSP